MEEHTARELWDAANRTGLEFIDWSDRHDADGDVVEGFALPGRWTATVAGAKVGKSILLISMSVEVSEGRDPWTGEEREPLDVVYIDSEMGRVDIAERLDDCGYEPTALKRWHACDIPPRLDTVDGAAKVMVAVIEHNARLVIIDGLNGIVSGAEKDDTPWRDLYEFTIRPLKGAGVAVVSADNHGKDMTLGPRGSSVKLDKADAIIRVTRTEGGVALTATHRRTAAYTAEVMLDVVGLDGTEPVRYRTHGGRVWPDGTKRVAALLDELGVPLEMGRPSARRMLRTAAEGAVDPDRYGARNDVLGAAIRWRKRQNECTNITVIQGGDKHGKTGVSGTTMRTVNPQPIYQGGQHSGTARDRPGSVGGRVRVWPVGTHPARTAISGVRTTRPRGHRMSLCRHRWVTRVANHGTHHCQLDTDHLGAHRCRCGQIARVPR